MSESLRNDGRVWTPKNPGDKRPAREIPEEDRDYYLERKYPSFGNLVPRDVASRNAKQQVDEGKGVGEGIVIKNYDFENKFGHTIWAKLITNQFKEKHVKEMGACHKKFKAMTEQKIIDKYVDKHLVDKIYAKIVNECEGWNMNVEVREIFIEFLT